jgi:hypothetical protein
VLLPSHYPLCVGDHTVEGQSMTSTAVLSMSGIFFFISSFYQVKMTLT